MNIGGVGLGAILPAIVGGILTLIGSYLVNRFTPSLQKAEARKLIAEAEALEHARREKNGEARAALITLAHEAAQTAVSNLDRTIEGLRTHVAWLEAQLATCQKSRDREIGEFNLARSMVGAELDTERKARKVAEGRIALLEESVEDLNDQVRRLTREKDGLHRELRAVKGEAS